MTDVNVASGFTANGDFSLKPTSVELNQEVVVVAESP